MQEEELEIKVTDSEKIWAISIQLLSFIGLLAFITVILYEIFYFLFSINIFDFLFYNIKETIAPNYLNLLYIIIPVVINCLIPYLMWKRARGISSFVEEFAKQNLNFQLSVTLYFIISIGAIFIIVGVILLFVLVLFDINSIFNAIGKARQGDSFRYPLAITFIR